MKNLIWILAAIMLAGCGDNEEGQDMGLHGDPPDIAFLFGRMRVITG
mgnify:CR=1 FL=1